MSNVNYDIDQMIRSNISELITLEEADKIVRVLGLFLEHAGFVYFLFLMKVPESILPYPKYLLVGALVKMLHYHHKNGDYEARDNLEKILTTLTTFIDDKEAIQRIAEKFNNTEFNDAYFSTQLPQLQISRMEDGYLIDGELWQFSNSRIEEIKNSLNIEV
jgi:hypothetical protein